MKLILVLILFASFSVVHSQNLIWEFEIDQSSGNDFIILPDLDGDGCREFISGKNIYSFSDGDIKYILNIPNEYSFRGLNDNSEYQLGTAYYDFNNNGVKDLFFVDWADTSTKIIEPTNSEILLSVKGYVENVADFNGDGSIELLIGYNTPDHSQYYMYLYSTGIINLQNKSNRINKYRLNQNYPNPFNPSTKIEYTLPEKSFVEIWIFNAIGEKVKTIVNMEQSAGFHSAYFNGNGLSSGVYFYQLVTDNFTDVKKMILVR